MSSKSPVEPAAVVEAPTLKEALRLVRQRYGNDARVIRSRTVTRRQPRGLGQRKVVEVLIQAAAGRARESARPAAASTHDAGMLMLAGEIAAEVDRIETLVRTIARRETSAGGKRRCRQNAVAAALVEAGADPGVVVRLCQRCQAETGAAPRDEQALLKYLGRNLPTVHGGWQDLAGLHIFVGPPGAGRSELILKIAARLGELQRRVLVLSLLPRHAGEIRRLQTAAANFGFDAAVLQKPSQLHAAADHLRDYEVVLLDAPAFGPESDPQALELRHSLIRQTACHRHLVFPLDRDLRDSQTIFSTARLWACDWLVLTRIDQTARRGKILDILDQLPLPISLVGDPAEPPQLASSDLLIRLILGSGLSLAASEE